MMNRIAVLISDVHFNLTTLPLASAALKAALLKAEELQIPLIIAGDLNDSKAIIRAEVANTLISILENAKVKILILNGNHDLVNEKGSEHGLNYLRPYANVIDEPTFDWESKLFFIPYQNNIGDLKNLLRDIVPKTKVIMHQGFLGAQMGDYIQDKTSIDPILVKDFTVISGHYHRHQTIGTVTYIGSPYTITFGEANDGPKGFLILNEDGTFQREVINLRKHIIVNRTFESAMDPIPTHTNGDLVWLKITGTKSQLDTLDKKNLGLALFGHSNFKLDLFPLEGEKQLIQTRDLTDGEVLDQIIDNGANEDKEKSSLKSLWRSLLDETT